MLINKYSKAFVSLGHWINSIDTVEKETLFAKVRSENPWFTDASIDLALTGISEYLSQNELQTWLASYSFSENRQPKTVALVLAGNIPMVGFHDILCVLIAGHKAMIKLSSKDSVLTRHVLDQLVTIEPSFADKIQYVEKLENFDAVIATGSDNSSRYFDYYFGKYPNIIRKNRTSIAVLNGFETKEELRLLGKDVFSYFGLGCRNVSKILAPKGYDFTTILKEWEGYGDIINHHKYRNNYDYQLAIRMVNKEKFFDNGFILMIESDKIVSPIAVLYTQHYESENDLAGILKSISEKTQCIVGNKTKTSVPFGQAQLPKLNDYADHIDTMKFLCDL